VLHLRVTGPSATLADVAGCLDALPGAQHVLRLDERDSGRALVTADLMPDAADAALAAVRRLGVPEADVALLRLDSIGPTNPRRPLHNVVWADLLSQAGTNARPFARYLVLMAVAGTIAAYGVIYRNPILIVGAMAVSPDTLPVTAACTGLVLRRWRLAARALETLVIGLGVGCAVAFVLTVILRALDLLPSGFEVGEGGLQGLSTVNSSTILVALAAGIAGMLALETRASAAVGVAISVTTIPASAYLGVAAGVGEESKATGALVVLGVNVAMLLVGGSATLIVQRALARRSARHADHDDDQPAAMAAQSAASPASSAASPPANT
jgi:uncharacterized hydrophobic protein (TIGR00271 family)